MKYIVWFFIFSISLFAKEVHVATYNVENLFDGVNNGNEYKDFKVGKNGWNRKMANIKLNHTIKAIKYINADIIALQEIENVPLLKALGKSTGFKYFAFTKPKGSPIGVGVLSKYPILKKQKVKPGIKRTRDFLRVIIDIGGEKLTLWVVHFPTQKYSFSQRITVAKHLKKAVISSKDKNILLLGDFNTKISSKSILQKTFGNLNEKRGFYDPWFSVPYQNRYSQSFFGKKSALDRIILGEGLFDGKGLEYKKNSFKAIRGDFLSDKKGNPNRWKVKGRRHQGRGYSDHFPVMLTLDIDTISKVQNVQKTETEQTYIEDLYHKKLGNCEYEVKKAVVLYKNGSGVILSQKGRGIYVYKSGYNLKLNHAYDVVIRNLKEYKGVREVSSLEILKDHGKINNINSYYLPASKLKSAKIGDVIININGTYKKGYLDTKYGKIKLYYRGKKSIKDGEVLHLPKVRVSEYKGRLELIWEKK